MYQTYNKMAILRNCNFVMVMILWGLEARKKGMRDRCCQQLIGIQRKIKWNYRRNAIFASPVQFISTVPACSVKTLHCQNGLVVTVNKISSVRLWVLVYIGKILFHWPVEGTEAERKHFSILCQSIPERMVRLKAKIFLSFHSVRKQTNPIKLLFSSYFCTYKYKQN